MKFKLGDLVTKHPNALFPPSEVIAAYQSRGQWFYELRETVGNGALAAFRKSAAVVDRDYVKSPTIADELKKPEDRKTPGRKPGVKGPEETIEVRYRLPVDVKAWIDANGKGKGLARLVREAMKARES